jgi:hypothetical protein
MQLQSLTAEATRGVEGSKQQSDCVKNVRAHETARHDKNEREQ